MPDRRPHRHHRSSFALRQSLNMAAISRNSYLHLLESGLFSDLVVECQGIEFKVHRNIVCSGSRMLMAACNGSFKVCE